MPNLPPFLLALDVEVVIDELNGTISSENLD
jgi:hypothetical protein